MGRKKRISDEDLLEAARMVFVEEGIGASTREIAKLADISEAVIYQRFGTKADLFFAAMAPPAPEMEELFAPLGEGEDIGARLERIGLGMLEYFREMMPILIPLLSHPSFDYEEFVKRHPESPLTLVREGMMAFLGREAELGRVSAEHYRASGLVLVATMHSIALFEKMGAHGGRFEEGMVKGVVGSIWNGLKG